MMVLAQQRWADIMEEEDEVWALHGLTLADIVWLQSGVEARVCQCVRLHNKSQQVSTRGQDHVIAGADRQADWSFTTYAEEK
eukprot:5096235-Amphidinium_carterae.1